MPDAGRLPPGVLVENAELMLIDTGGVTTEELYVDPERGPWVFQADGSASFLTLKPIARGMIPTVMGPQQETRSRYPPKRWSEMSSTEQQVMLQMAARKNQKLREWKGAAFCDIKKLQGGDARECPEEDRISQEETEALERKVRERVEMRCTAELVRPPTNWWPISIDTVTNNSERRAPGMIYGIEFPWTEEMLAEFGPRWLTEAFHAAGSLEKDNRVLKITLEQKIKVTTGNNGGKFLFEVEYAYKTPELHTRLFAKVPFPLGGATKSDRLSSSVNKQPQELWEINTYRLLEAWLPVKTPRYYFGDISNETSNWILITERVMFADHAGMNFGKPPAQRRKPLRPFQIEGPYDKCVDYNLRGPDKEYYLLLIRKGAQMAGLDKAGKLGPGGESVMANFGRPRAPIDMPEAWGVNPDAPSGEDPDILSKKLESAVKFFSDTGRVLFPDYVEEEYFKDKLITTLMTVSAYSAEIAYWKHRNPDYSALAHTNMNVDNAYFWRDKAGNLDCGVFDWGAMGSGCLGHKLWWWLYCGDFGPFRRNLTEYLETFARTYEEYGGPRLDVSVLETMVIITALEQMLGLCAAVPQIMKMCPAKEWATINNRYDRRISLNVDGKSTLRLYLHVQNTIIRIVEEMNGDKVMQRWIQDVWVNEMGRKRKA